MTESMGTFRIDVEIASASNREIRRALPSVLVDTGAELSVFPSAVLEALSVERLKQLRFRQAGGSVLIRWTGPAIIYAANTVTTDEVVFGESGDLVLLGARTIEGLNLRVDPIAKRLVDAGPMPLAAVG